MTAVLAHALAVIRRDVLGGDTPTRMRLPSLRSFTTRRRS